MKNFLLPFLCWVTIKSLSPLIAADEHASSLSNSITNSMSKVQTNQPIIEDLPAISGKTLQDVPAQTTSPPPQNNGFFLFWPFRMGFQHVFHIFHRTCIFLGITKPPRQITYEQSEQGPMARQSQQLPPAPSIDLVPIPTETPANTHSHQQSLPTVAPLAAIPAQAPTNTYSYGTNMQTNPFIQLYGFYAQSHLPNRHLSVTKPYEYERGNS